jgi:formylglycine-generating enzyme required for sulfatase activity
MSRKPLLLCASLFCLLGGLPASAADAPSSSSDPILKANTHGELLAPPATPEDYPAWAARLRAYRSEVRPIVANARGELPDPYSERALQWARRSFIQPQMMAHDRFFYDLVKRRYTVDRYLDDLRNRYGGIDSVLIWPTYPNIGVDSRNQFDLWRDMPGGLDGLRQMVRAFHRRGVHVLFPIMIWDRGTRDEGGPMAEGLVALARQTGADGFNGDTMSPIGREFYMASLAARHPLALEPENGLGKDVGALAWNTLSWGYWWPYQFAPGVDRYKFLEPRHLTHVCDRWAHDRTDMLQYAFFNGDGYESWENVWGIWNGITPRDAEALRRISMIYRSLPALLTSPDYEPHTPTLQPGVFATRFPVTNLTLWTVVNRSTNHVSGEQLEVPCEKATRFFDLWRGVELPVPSGASVVRLSFDLEPRGFGAVLAVQGRLDSQLQKLLSAMRSRGGIALLSLSAQWQVLTQHLADAPTSTPVSEAPPGMVRIPGGMFLFEVEGIMIEKSEGVDVQYPWEHEPSLKHHHELQMKPIFIDRHPVTCAEFKQFVQTARYRPADAHNFLRNWTSGGYPAAWEKKPVTWVSLEDARAYAKCAGKRLPHEWEWQYAAQGTDGRKYPWGNEKNPSCLPPFEEGREEGPPADVNAYPAGASPYGVLDFVGNVWQWTDEYQDEHTRAAVLRGGSRYRPTTSGWYFPQAQQLNQHGKYLLMAASLDRSANIGFRCVRDAR